MNTLEYLSWTDFSASEQRTLQFAPLWLFSSLVGRASRVNALERQALRRCLAAAGRTSSGRLGEEVLTSVDANLDELLDDFAADTRSIATGLREVSDLLDRLPVHEARVFRQMLVGGFGAELTTVLAPFGRGATAEDVDKLRLTAELLVP